MTCSYLKKPRVTPPKPVVVVRCRLCGGTAERYEGARVCNRVVDTAAGRQVCCGVLEVEGRRDE
jgi:hypothetical protein